MVGHLIATIIHTQEVIHAIRGQFLNDGIGLLTDRDVHHLGHGSVVVHVASLDADGGVALEAVTVHPLAQAGVARVPEHAQDGPTAHVGVAVLLERAIEPTDTGGASDRVQAEGPDVSAVVAVDREAHCVSVDVASIRPLGVRRQGPS